MKFTVKTTSAAKEELRNIYRYISVNLDSPIAAERIYRKILSKMYSLDSMPERFRIYRAGDPIVRITAEGKYNILYTVRKEDNTVIILHIIYGGRDIDAELESGE